MKQLIRSMANIFRGSVSDRFILFPTTGAIDADGATRYVFEHRGRQIETFIARSDGAGMNGEPSAYVLEFCGNATRAERVAYRSAQGWAGGQSMEVWALNYPGYGKSQGPASLRSIPEAALASFDEIRRVARGRPIFVSGRSLGTAAALCVAARRKVAGVILYSPVDLRKLIVGQFGWWNLWIGAWLIALGVPRQLSSVENAGLVKAPTVVVITGADRLVVPRYQMAVAKALAGPTHLLILPHADHNDPMDQEEESRFEQQRKWLHSNSPEIYRNQGHFKPREHFPNIRAIFSPVRLLQVIKLSHLGCQFESTSRFC
jgi:hypothetical protein